MTDLTEQWKKGELPSGYYYIIVKKEFSNRIDFYNSSATIWSYNSNDVIKQVLAPVPSYEEYKRLKEVERKKGKLVNVNYKIKQENQQLKDIISKMCMELVDHDDDMSNGLAEYFNQDLILEIYEVLK